MSQQLDAIRDASQNIKWLPLVYSADLFAFSKDPPIPLRPFPSLVVQKVLSLDEQSSQ